MMQGILYSGEFLLGAKFRKSVQLGKMKFGEFLLGAKFRKSVQLGKMKFTCVHAYTST